MDDGFDRRLLCCPCNIRRELDGSSSRETPDKNYNGANAMKKRYFKIMLLIIFVLTIFDGISTWYGVSYGFIEEGNGIARSLFSISIPGTCAIMVLWTGALLWFISKKPYKWIPYAMLVVFAAKVYIAALHLAWLTKL